MTVQADRACAGVAFELTKEVVHSHVLHIDGCEVEVAKGQSVLVVRGSDFTEPRSTVEWALPIGLKALDLLAAGLNESYSLSSISDCHALWYMEGDDLVVRVVLRHLQEWGGPQQHEGRMVIASSAPLPLPLPANIEWHESFRYFRLSQTTDDLFEAYRNAYLALESILSVIAPPDDSGKKPEAEGVWMRRALGVAAQRVTLTGFAQGGGDPVDELMDIHYAQIRSGLSHAKVARPSLLPQTVADRVLVSRQLEYLVQLYQRLAQSVLGFGPARGTLTAGFMRSEAKKFLDASDGFVSSEPGPVRSVEDLLGAQSIALLAIGPAEDDPDDLHLAERVWRGPGDTVQVVRRAGMTATAGGALGSAIEPEVTTGWASSVELAIGQRGVSSGWFRSTYGA
jgi:hypothetical protein